MDDERWETSALAWLREAFAPREKGAQFELLPTSNLVPDGTLKWRISNAAGAHVAFAVGSAASDPQQTEQAVRNACRARAALSPEAGRAIIEPLFTGVVQGRWIATYPYCRPMAQTGWRGLMVRHWLAPRVLQWLRRVTAETTSPASGQELEECFRRPLKSIARDEQLGSHVAAAAHRALERLSAGHWHPQCTLMHNDLWRGNLLYAPHSSSNAYGFVVVDWAGSRLRGQGIYDFVRISRSLRLSRRTCQRALLQHCQALGCSPEDASGYLLAALGSIGEHLGGFPYARYRLLVADCFDYLQALAAAASPRRSEIRPDPILTR